MGTKTTFSDKDAIRPVPSPSRSNENRINDWWLLVLEVSWMIFKVFPLIFLAAFRRFRGKSKCIRGQVALVTGAGTGLGRRLALALSDEGCRIAASDINQSSAEDVAEEIRQLGGEAKAYHCNVACVEEVARLRKAITSDLGVVELLVNNAGVKVVKSVLDCPPDEVSSVISVNLLSHFWAVKEFLPEMINRNSGHIVAISSLASYVGGIDRTAYTASKYGVTGFMEAVRTELNQRPNNQIKTTTVCPFYINASDDYVKRWNFRMPDLSFSESVDAIIAGIKKEEVLFTIPKRAHYVVHVLRLFPDAVVDFFSVSLFARSVPSTKN